LLAAGLFGLWGFFTYGKAGELPKLLFGKRLDGLLFVAWIPLIFLIVRLLDTALFDIIMSRRRNVVAPQLLREIVALGLYLVLFGWVVHRIFGYSITAFLTTTTVVAAVLGLALQETLGNLFSGIALHLEDSFEVGDVLHSGDFTGVIEEVSWRATRIRTFNNNVVIVPNSVIARERVEVFPRNNLNARVLVFGVDYHVAPAMVIDVLTQAALHVDGVAREMPVFARIGGFTDSGVTYEVKYFTRDYSRRERIDADIRKAVWYTFQRNAISFATPIHSYQQYTPPAASTAQLAPGELLERLQQVELLKPLSAEALETLAGAARVHFYSRGETILRHGDAGDSMFIVHDGTVSIRISDDSEMGWHEVTQLGAGTVFGEMALLTGETRAADVVAVTDVKAIEIVKESLQPILHGHPELATALSAKMMERQGVLDSLRADEVEEEESTILSRIRAYFGL